MRSGERGITPVVATILLIALTIAAVSMVAAAVSQMQPTSRAPQVELGDIRAELIQADANNWVTRVSFTHQGGDFLVPKELRVTINGVNNLGVEASTSMQSTSENSITFGGDTAWLLSRAQDFSTPRGDPYYENGTEVEIFIVHNPSGMVLANVTTEVNGPFYPVYGDAGIPKYGALGAWEGAEILWDPQTGGASFEEQYAGEVPPKEVKCAKATTTTSNWVSWGVFLIYPSEHTIDLSCYDQLKFWVKTPEDLKVEIQQDDSAGPKFATFISQHGWDGADTWHEITIPKSAFSGANFSQIFSPFMITLSDATDKTFYVDQVIWEKVVSDFRVSVNPASGIVFPNDFTTAVVSVNAFGGYNNTVSLSASGQPSGVAVNFSPPSGTPSFTSIMTVDLDATVAPGTYTITITGVGADGLVKKYTYSLTVQFNVRGPVWIIGNSDFTEEKGVNGGGDGTASNPYVIKNWVINASGGDGVCIKDTSAYFIVRNCLIENGSWNDGIHLANVSNGKVENNISLRNDYGIYLDYSDNCTVTSNTCENNYYGIISYYSDNISLSNNICENNRYNFGVVGSSISQFDHDIDTSNLVNGKPIHYFRYENNLVIDSWDNVGYLGLVGCDNITVNQIVIENNYQGILLAFTENSWVENCVYSNNYHGIYSHYSNYNTLSGNTCNNNEYYGICLYYSGNSTVTSNTCENNYYGIISYYSDNISLSNNICENNRYNFGVVGSSISQFDHDIDTSNLVNGKPIHYFRYENNLVIDSWDNVGYLGLVGCDNITVNQIVIENNYQGILLAFTENSWVENCVYSNNYHGIYVYYSDNSTILNNISQRNSSYGIVLDHSENSIVSGNTSQGNGYYGICLYYSGNSTVTSNTCENNYYGIVLDHSENSIVSGNTSQGSYYYGINLSYSGNSTVSNNISQGNEHGIYLYSSSNSTVSNNISQGNSYYGIYLVYSSTDTLSNNICENNRYNFGVVGSSISQFDHDIDTSNLVNGKPIHYFRYENNLVIDSWDNVGYLGLVGCDNITVNQIVIENNYQGILLAFTENSWVENYICLNNYNGIYSYSSNYNTLSGNTCQGNSSHGVYFYSSNNNTLSSNTVEGNSQARDNTYDGIFVGSYSDYNNIEGNTVRKGTGANQQRYGMRIDSSSCDNNSIINNDLVNSGVSGGISDRGTGTIIAGNLE